MDADPEREAQTVDQHHPDDRPDDDRGRDEPTIGAQTKAVTSSDGELGFFYENCPQTVLRAPKLPGTNAGPKRYFITVQRKAALANQALATALQFRTTLTYLKTLRMKVDEEYTWGPAADEITAEFAYDRPGPTDCTKAPCEYIELNDDQIWQPIPKTLQRSFVETLIPTLWDEFGDSDETWLAPQWFSQYGVEMMVIKSMGASQPGAAEQEFVWSNSTDVYHKDDADYWYTIQYWLSHDPRVLKSHRQGD